MHPVIHVIAWTDPERMEGWVGCDGRPGCSHNSYNKCDCCDYRQRASVTVSASGATPRRLAVFWRCHTLSLRGRTRGETR